MGNPGYMHLHCPVTCGVCEGKCKDTNATACAVWGTQGQCQETPAYMAKECPATCGICTNVCEDKETDCASWAKNGQCEKNSVHMLTKCPQSCGLCSRLEKFYSIAIDGKPKDEL